MYEVLVEQLCTLASVRLFTNAYRENYPTVVEDEEMLLFVMVFSGLHVHYHRLGKPFKETLRKLVYCVISSLIIEQIRYLLQCLAKHCYVNY